MGKLSEELFIDNHYVELGTVRKEFVDFFNTHGMNGLVAENIPIVFWEDRIFHTERHKKDFFSDVLYRLCFEEIPQIIFIPDYISIHPNRKDSISFIKDYSESHINVAIRVSFEKLSYRTMYPIIDATLTHYLDKENAWKVSYDEEGMPIIVEK